MARRTSVVAVAVVLLAVAAGGVWLAEQGSFGVVPQDDAQRDAVERGLRSPDRRALEKVAALGRIEPRDGLIRVAGPPRVAVVIQQLDVNEGDWVQSGQVIAVLLGNAVDRAEVSRLTAQLENAQQELNRNEALFRRHTISESDLRTLELDRDVAAAALQRAQAELELSSVRAPIDAQVIAIHAREGERVERDGIVELGDTSAMYAVAEVYETDIGRIHVGQPATIRSPVFPHPLTGTVERIGLKIGKKDVLSTDPQDGQLTVLGQELAGANEIFSMRLQPSRTCR